MDRGVVIELDSFRFQSKRFSHTERNGGEREEIREMYKEEKSEIERERESGGVTLPI